MAGEVTLLAQEQENIEKYMENLLHNYDKIRGMSKAELGRRFWDAVVLTASDESQRDAYEKQIAEKLSRREMPLGLPYLVYADPPGPRAGCGTSTMEVLEKLEEQYGEKLSTWRVLLLNAGGQSQRLPSASVLGKLFTPLPIGNPMYQMLDMKLANYLPFLQKMGPGYLHAGSDTIEVFDINDKDDWTWDRPGFTVSAQPASPKIGCGHGVYAVNDIQLSKNKPTVQMLDTLEVLQKPSMELLYQKCAVHNKDTTPWVYTDSIFYFDHDVAATLREFYKINKPLNCEIDSYGDFLQALGPRATMDYVHNVKNVGNVEPNLIKTRKKLFELLKGTPLNTVALNVSKFYHFGTLGEYIFHFCEDKQLAKELGIRASACSRFTEVHPSVDNPKFAKISGKMDGVVMHSILPNSSVIHKKAIVEYCDFDVPLHIKENSILSNCQCSCKEIREISLPENIILHTIPITDAKGQTSYVTTFFALDDDIKKKSSWKDARALKFLGKPLKETVDKLGLEIESVFQGQEATSSLWCAKLFSSKATMSKSFLSSLKQLRYLTCESNESPMDQQEQRYSMVDLMQLKDISQMLAFRNELYKKITLQ